jgi:hypothetical protein
MLKNLRDTLARITLPAAAYVAALALLAAYQSWPVVAALAVAAAVYVLAPWMRAKATVGGELEAKAVKLNRLANRLGAE